MFREDAAGGNIELMNGITLITPTGDRPLAFALCQRWMKNQTLQADQWIVVDDGKVPLLKPTARMEYVRRKPQSNDPKFTLIKNLKAAIPHIKGNKIIIIEDDEYYAPNYVKTMAAKLNEHEIVGIGNSKYYHLSTGSNMMIGNRWHASLAQTAFRSSFLAEFERHLNPSNDFLDMRLWKGIRGNGRGFIFLDGNDYLYVGIKGLPGRQGIGTGHNPNSRYYRRFPRDISRRVLRKWIPIADDFRTYIDIINGKPMKEKIGQLPMPAIKTRNITGITVCCNTKNLMKRAYESVRRSHPDMPIIIIDGSDPENPCASYVKSLSSKITTTVSLGHNIGHGKGLCMGIDQAKTKYALIFDSDIEMLKSPVNRMLEMMEEDTFGIGYIEKTGFDGFEYGSHAAHKNQSWMPYLHPYFQLINIENYRKFHPYVHHGAPCFLTMRDIYNRGLSNIIIKEFPGLGHSSGKGWNWEGRPRKYIRHDTRGTRDERLSRNLGEIKGPWEYK